MSEPGIDSPEVDAEAQVSLPACDVMVSSRVESVRGELLSLRPSIGELVGQTVVVRGTLLEVQWRGPGDQRAVPAEVTAVESGVVPRWWLRMTGPAEVVQRRKAVRGRVAAPVEVGIGGLQLAGRIIDLSEDGARVDLDDFSGRPQPGDPVDLRIDLGDDEVLVPGTIVRLAARGARSILITRFTGIGERDQDRIRRRVFRALREERARLAD